MPAAPERTVLARIPDGEDREINISQITFPAHPEWPDQIEISTYIPSTDTHTRGFIFAETHRAKVAAGLRRSR